MASLSTKAGRPVRSTTRSRIGRFSIGRLTAATARPFSWSIVAGIPIPTASTPGRAALRLGDLAHQQLDQLLLALAGGALAALPDGLGVAVEDAEQHLRTAQIDAYRFGLAHLFSQLLARATAGIGMIPESFMANDGEQRPSGPPDYKVYRARRGFFSRFRKPDLSGLRGARLARAEAAEAAQTAPAASAARGRPDPGLRRALKWVGLAALGWILLSFLAFAVSAQLQAFKLSGEAKSALHGNPFLLPSAQTILVLGTDARPPDTKEPGAAPSQECFEQQAHGDAPHGKCSARRIPRRHADADPRRRRRLPQTLDPARQLRRNPRPEPAEDQRGLRLRRRQGARSKRSRDFLGIEVDHVAIVDFTGFEDLIDAVGGVEVDVPHKICADISGGAGGGQGGFTLRLGKGENTLDGEKALIYSRIREPSECPGPGKSAYTLGYEDLDREKAQQAVISGIKDRLTDPLRAPLQLRQGPDHRLGRAEGLRQRHGLLHDAAADPGGRDRRRKRGRRALQPAPTRAASRGPAGSIEVPDSERRRAVKKLLGE